MANIQFKANRRIQSDAERVWSVIVAIERPPEWNPTLRQVIPQKGEW
jgi:hypothetical protein